MYIYPHIQSTQLQTKSNTHSLVQLYIFYFIYLFFQKKKTRFTVQLYNFIKSNIQSVPQVEQFWRFYSHMIRPGDLTGHSDFHLFKEGIKPMWEVHIMKNYLQMQLSYLEQDTEKCDIFYKERMTSFSFSDFFFLVWLGFLSFFFLRFIWHVSLSVFVLHYH